MPRSRLWLCSASSRTVVERRPPREERARPEVGREAWRRQCVASKAAYVAQLEELGSAVVRPRWHVVGKQDESAALDEKRGELARLVRGKFGKEYARDDGVSRRFLTARENDAGKAAKLLTQALEWRAFRRPDVHDYAELEVEARTGKVRVAARPDRFGRPIVVFDNSAQNTDDPAANMRFLAFNLEHALRVAEPPVEKMVIFMHMTDFSLANNPSWAVTKETCKMLTACFCECCGHIVVYGAPRVFSLVFAAVKPLVDKSTATKIVFASADDDALVRDVIGPDWRDLTGAGRPRESPRSSPGYRHREAWLRTLADELRWRRRTGNTGALRHDLVNWPGDHPLHLDEARVFPRVFPGGRPLDDDAVVVVQGPLDDSLDDDDEGALLSPVVAAPRRSPFFDLLCAQHLVATCVFFASALFFFFSADGGCCGGLAPATVLLPLEDVPVEITG